MNDIEAARLIAEKVKEKGGETYFVGGCVRDRLMGRSGGDIDVEVHGVEVDTLCAILDGIGNRIGMGESFGIFTLAGLSLDIAMPRKERATGRGHRDLETSVDPFAGVQAAAKRRDFTVNAIMENVLTGEISDPYGGIEDIKKKVLRHVDGVTFGEDPLRVLRAARFAATLGFAIAPGTLEICKKTDISALSRERIEGETKKALLVSEKPSVFFNSLKEMGQLGVWFGELNALDGVEQSRKYHPEGDAFVHTMAVVDYAAEVSGQDYGRADGGGVLRGVCVVVRGCRASCTDRQLSGSVPDNRGCGCSGRCGVLDSGDVLRTGKDRDRLIL